jgi:hypothetical protein
MMRDSYDTPVLASPSTAMDFNGGFLCQWVYWRPNPGDPDPDMPGLKQKITMYMPVEPEAACLCGSGKSYGACCRLRRYWYPICPNPLRQGYSFLVPQQAIFPGVDGRAIAQALWDDVRLHDVEATPARSFWVYWGEPALQSRYGIICFGDFELRERRTLIVTAMSDRRMRTLLGVLRDTGITLPAPRMSYDRVQVIEKSTGKIELLPPPKKKRRS